MAAKTQQASASAPSGNGANNGSGDPISQAGKAFVDAAAAWQQEVADFMARRWQRNLQCCEEMWSCAEPKQAVDLQYRYAQSAAEDYLKETHRLLDIATRVSEESLNVMQSSTRHALEQMDQDK
jgi:phasin family protein